MKKKIVFYITAAAMVFGIYAANAASDKMKSAGNDKTVSHISDVKNMPDDSMVYIQGYLTENLGDEVYTFQDDSGTMMVEIDEELMNPNTFSPTTLVWIAAEVDKKGDIISLDAEEIQFLPNQANNTNK